MDPARPRCHDALDDAFDRAPGEHEGESRMSPRAARFVSRGIVVFIVAVSVPAILLSLDDRYKSTEIAVVGDPAAPGMAEVRADLERRIAEGERFEPDVVGGTVVSLFALFWAITGSLIVSRQPRNTAGWIFCVAGSSVAILLLASGYVTYSVRLANAPLPGQDGAALIAEHGLVVFGLIPLLVLLFPDGRPPSRRWRWAEWGLLAGSALALTAFALTPGPLNNLVDNAGILYQNPIGVDAFRDGGPGNAFVLVGALIVLGAALASVVAVRQRYKRSHGEERQQMRWLVAVATVAGTGIALMLVSFPMFGLLGLDDERFSWLFNLFLLSTVLAIFVGIPVAYLVAILRHGLWDLDVVIKKALVALVLTMLMAGIGVAIVVIAGRLAISGGADGISIALGIALGLLFVPLLRVARRIAGRLAFGKRASPYEVLAAFGERVGETYSTDDVLPRMARLLAEGTGATSAQVLLRVGAELREKARWPETAPAAPDAHVVPVVDRGQELGALAISMPASDPMNPAKDKLVHDVAAQAGLVLRNVKLIEELRASRQRLVAAQDEERRKLERNIHDGAQQQLVALAVKLRLADGMLDRDSATAHQLLGQLQEETHDALENLRDLARGIYPPLLADRGLPAALEAQARKSAIPVRVEADGIGRYPQDVEAAIYFCALEALNNVAKYAQASSATLRLAQEDGHLTFTVTDDGRGFDPSTTAYGTGMQGMDDRLDAIGGRLAVTSAPGTGTHVIGTVPTTVEADRA
jgi:signal transduction histidine kinase